MKCISYAVHKSRASLVVLADEHLILEATTDTLKSN